MPPFPPTPLPAWIWLPSRRTLPNTFVLFRRELTLERLPASARGWICADSRYRLALNGERVLWGPAPADPRHLECDPIDLTGRLEIGQNVLGATVLFYGHGDGTSPLGKPGFWFWLELTYPDGTFEHVLSDESWACQLARGWQAGSPKRWFLRALREHFDARAHPHGFSRPGFRAGPDWRPAMRLAVDPLRSPISGLYPDPLNDASSDPEHSGLGPRSIPLMAEAVVEAHALEEAYRLHWHLEPLEALEFEVPDAYRATPLPLPPRDQAGWPLEPGCALTFSFAHQQVGFPILEVDAPEGALLELRFQEAHALGGPALLPTPFGAGARLSCVAGRNTWESFDFESLRWVQVVALESAGPVTVRRVALRTRRYPFVPPTLQTSDAALNTLLEANVRTLENSLQELPVDGMGRERQQYSGDCGHQLHIARLGHGDHALPERHFRTYAQGQTQQGYFLDCWPAPDRLTRLAQRELGLTPWGPILDHSVGFVMDAHHHYLHTGRLEPLAHLLPRFGRFVEYLERLRGDQGWLPVVGLGIPTVWLDHDAYLEQGHKRCAFNLYASAMLEHHLAPLAQAAGLGALEDRAARLGRELREATVRHTFDPVLGSLVCGHDPAGGPRHCDRSLATAVLYRQLVALEPSLDLLEHLPTRVGLSYPANANWRLWALARGGRMGAVLRDLRGRWAGLESVRHNGTLAEMWEVRPDSGSQWSHCAAAPLLALYQGLTGLRPLEPGYARLELRPQPADLEAVHLIAYTGAGPLDFRARGPLGDRTLELRLPVGSVGELLLPPGESVALERLPAHAADGLLERYRVRGEVRLTLERV